MKNKLLKLLLLARPMDTAVHWRDALKQLEGHDDQQTERQQDTQTAASPEATSPAHFSSNFLDAVDAVVPHLPEYSALSTQLEALLEFCQVAYPLETDRMVCIWLQRGTSASTAFRTWLLEWITTTKKPFEHGEDVESEASKQQWRHALFAAAVVEEHVKLKRALIQLLHRAGPMQPADDQRLQPQNPQQQASISVEELLDFYWDHAEELMPFSLLCAVKLHALASTSVQLTDGVLVRLRWSKLLKPIFFEALLSHCLALKVFQSNVGGVDTFDVHRFLQLQVTKVSWTTRNLLLKRILVVKERLEDAYKANAAYFVMKDITTKSLWTESAVNASGQAFLALAANQQRLVLLDLERDLEDAPLRIFPHILISFGPIVNAALSSDAQASDGALRAALKSLFVLFDLRRDHDSCVLVAALVVELRLVQHPIWNQAPELFAEVVELLNGAFAMGTDAQKRWVLQMLLQQLLFECDAGVLEQNLPTLASFLPPRLLRLAAIRLS